MTVAKSKPALPAFNPAELKKLKAWLTHCISTQEAALNAYEASGLTPDNKMLAKAIEHYRGSVAGLRYFLWLVDSRKPQRRKQVRRKPDGTD